MLQGGIYFDCSVGGKKFDSGLEGRMGWFTIFHVKATKKVTIILKLRKKDSFFGLQDLQNKKIMQISYVYHLKFFLKNRFYMS